uniref:LIM zinc-binding domain-containing protein n=1 Tax=Trichuris muris TaxID=70415 RepID=A0A5S6QUE9_TRIMR
MASPGSRPKCYVCCQEILPGQAIQALNHIVCEQHMTCMRCNKSLKCDVWAFDNKLYCRACYSLVTQKILCKSCAGQISDVALKEVGTYWHKACFVCQTCRQGFPDGRYYLVNDMPYCRAHAEELNAKEAKPEKMQPFEQGKQTSGPPPGQP